MNRFQRFSAQATVQPAAELPQPGKLSRREFLLAAGSSLGGLMLGVQLVPALAKGDKVPAPQPHAFVRIGTDNSVTVISKHLEMGQGAFTGLATLLADELDADWAQVTVEAAPADVTRYANTLYGVQGTGGSTAMANAHRQMRRAGAAARAMMVAAAAERWKVAPGKIRVSAGVVSTADKKHSATFGELAEDAARQPVPADVRLKTAEQFTLIGRQHLPRKDSSDKVNGRAMFTQDIKLPGMLVAVVAHPPRFGGRVKQVDDSAARAISGVVDVVRFDGGTGRPEGVAVLAKNTWIAAKGRDALKITWDDTEASRADSAELFESYAKLADKPGAVARNTGDALSVLGKAGNVIRADYRLPYLSHAPMEPLNCVAHVTDDACELWNGVQMQTFDQLGVAALLGIKPEKVTINQQYAGGSFGRRANPHSDYVLEAVSIAKAARGKGHAVPVKLVWMREDDMHAGYYRPQYLHRVQVALGPDKLPLAWHQRIVGQSVLSGTPFEKYAVKDGVDNSSVEGAGENYEIPNIHVDLHSPDPGVPVLWWRSVGHTHTGFVNETMIDELATAAGADPVDFRLKVLEKGSRLRGVLETASKAADWHKPLPPGGSGERRGRGVAVVKSFNSYVAEIAEITIDAKGKLRVDRVVCAVDCGLAINPDVIRAQMEGGIGFGLTAALYSRISLKDGKVEQANFNNYPMLRIADMPKIEVHIVPSAEDPTGVGEPGVPPIAPALANAIFAATGKRIRDLPIGTQIEA